MIQICVIGLQQHIHQSHWIQGFSVLSQNIIQRITGEQCSSVSPDAITKDTFCILVLDVNSNEKNVLDTAKYNTAKTYLLSNGKPESIGSFATQFEFTGVINPESFDIQKFSKSTGLLALTDVAYHISEANKEASKQKKNTIYLSLCTPDIEAERENVKRELLQLGYNIVPDLEKGSDLSEEVLLQQMQNADLILHFLGNEYGEILASAKASLPELQHQIAGEMNNARLEAGKKAKKRFVWLPVGLKPDTEKQELFIAQLRNDEQALKNTEIIQNPIEEFKNIVRNFLSNTLEDAAEIGEAVNIDGGYNLYLIGEKRDQQKLIDIQKELVAKGANCKLPDFATLNMVKQHRQNLVECDGVVIYSSVYNKFWVDSKLKDLLKAKGYGRVKPFKVKAVLIENSNGELKSKVDSDVVVLSEAILETKTIIEPIIEKLSTQ